MDKVVACETCGLVQEVDHARPGSVVKCARGNFQIFHRRPDSRKRTLAFSLAAAILCLPSNLYPIVNAEYQGQFVQTTIFQGIKALWHDGQYFISGLEMNAESAQTLVSGGIAFATAGNYGPVATNGAVFYLNKKEDVSWDSWNPAIMLGAMPEGQKSKNSLPQIQSQ